jgi:DNA-binding NarL/FixJ family response regulator
LSRREEEILRLLASGLTDREIGEALTISTRTVETHVSNILRKLDARNRAEASRRYLELR